MAPPKKKMLLNAFHMTTIQHTSTGFWRHPRARTEEYKSLDLWIEYAKILEEGGFDTLFFADLVAFPNTYADGSSEFAVEHAMEVPAIDPSYVIPAVARETTSLGFALTFTTSYEHPYFLARTLSTLDHITDGRVGWNIVTSFSKTAAIAIGDDNPIPHDERYDRADEFMEVTYKLLEGSWEDDAVLVDRESGRFSDPAKVHEIHHEGKYYNIPGIHVSEPSPQRTPVLFQAGSSARGQQFSGRHAEGVFLASIKPEDAKVQISQIRAQAKTAGRRPDDVKIVCLMTVVAAESDEAARAKAEDYFQYFDYEGQMAIISNNFGIDLSKVDPESTLDDYTSDAIQGILEIFTKRDPDRTWMVRDIVNAHRLGGPGPLLIGGPETIADELEEWMRISDADGFMFSNSVLPVLTTDFIEFVVPVLRERGLIDPAPSGEPVTLRQRIFGAGDRLPARHPGAAYRPRIG